MNLEEMPTPQPLTYDDAVEVLKKAPFEYQFALKNVDSFWTTRTVARGIGITTLMLNGWIERDPNLIPGSYRIAGGYNTPRTQMIIFVAQFFLNRGIWDLGSGLNGE